MILRQFNSFLLIFCMVFSGMSFGSCSIWANPDNGIDYRGEMRNFIKEISSYAKSSKPGFIIIPQNGQALLTKNGNADGHIKTEYINAIGATGRENLFYGYQEDDKATPASAKEYMLKLCRLCKEHNIEVLVTDYCSTPNKVDTSYYLNESEGFISFAANKRELNTIPPYPSQPYNQNNKDIDSISKAENFLYLLNTENYSTKQDIIESFSATNYDVIIMDLFHNGTAFNKTEIDQLKVKKNGGNRMVIAYMSIGEAEEYRYYWNENWSEGSPEWLEKENPQWDGNYKVRYWNKNWQDIIFGTESSYVKKILDAGFDGAYLDIVDAYEYYE